MEKTTVYMPSDLRAALKRAAGRRGVSEAELIRQGIEIVAKEPRKPRLPLFDSGLGDLAERVDEYMAGFGEH
jgi:hypothetical protein